MGQPSLATLTVTERLQRVATILFPSGSTLTNPSLAQVKQALGA